MTADASVPVAPDARSRADHARCDHARRPPDGAPDAASEAVDARAVDVAAAASCMAFQAAPDGGFADIAVFEKALRPGSATTATLDRLAAELGELADAQRTAPCDGCAFDFELPGLGRMEGRISIRRGHADLELHALRPGAAAALRARQHELQRKLDQASGGDVSLFIV